MRDLGAVEILPRDKVVDESDGPLLCSRGSAAVGTVGGYYKINRKYFVSAFQQYDFRYNDGSNLATSVSFVRKFPRWYVAFSFSYVEATDEVTFVISFWPEGVPELNIGSGHLETLGISRKN